MVTSEKTAPLRIYSKPPRRQRLIDDSGAASIEYAVMVALIGIVSMGAISLLGQNTKRVLQQVSQAIDGVPDHAPIPRGPAR